MAQNTVFAQIIKLIPRTQFESSVARYDGNKGTRNLDCWTWFGALLFGQLTGHDSIRAIERVFANSDSRMKKLGFNNVKRSTLADANKVRPLGILEDTFGYLLRRARSCAPQKNGFRFNGQVLALDGSLIELSLKLCPWARFHSERASIKLNTAIDIAGDLPEFVVIDQGRSHDLHAARKMQFKPDTTIVMDRNYISYDWMNKLNEDRVYFVTRSRTCLKLKVLKCRKTNRTRGHICDQIVKPVGERGKKYKGKLRKITYKDPYSGKRLTFITNRFDLATQTICDLYKARWKIEIFFKTLKQNLKIRKFLGTSTNAVKAQIWTALIAYLMVQIWRFQAQSTISMPSAMAVIGVLLLFKEPIKRLLGDIPHVTRHPPPLQLMLPI